MTADARPELPAWIKPHLHTVEEVAQLLRLSTRHVRRLIVNGRLPAVRLGRAVRIRPEAVAAVLESKDKK